MLFNTPSQFIVLGIVLIAGWLLGLASHPGGKKWKRAYQEEKALHARNRDLAETQARADRARIMELERTNAELARERDTVVARGGAPVSRHVAPVTFADRPRRTGTRWFDWDTTRRI